jgi:hypothetical protein
VGCFGRLGATSAKSTTPRHLARPRRPLLLRRTDRTYPASLLRPAALLRLAAHAAPPTQHQRAPPHTSPRRSTAAKRHPIRSTLLRLASTMSTVQGARRWSSGRLFTLRSISVPASPRQRCLPYRSSSCCYRAVAAVEAASISYTAAWCALLASRPSTSSRHPARFQPCS